MFCDVAKWSNIMLDKQISDVWPTKFDRFATALHFETNSVSNKTTLFSKNLSSDFNANTFIKYLKRWQNDQTLFVKYLRYRFTSNVWQFGHVAKHCLISRSLQTVFEKLQKQSMLASSRNSSWAMLCHVAKWSNNVFDKQISNAWQTIFDRTISS